MAAGNDGTTGGAGLGGKGEVILIGQIALLLLVGRGLGELLQRHGQPAIVGQLLAGLILGPSLFGWLWPSAHALIFPAGAAQKNLIAGISNVGIMMLLLLTGMETDLKLVRQVRRPAILVAAVSVAVPFSLGFALGALLPAEFLSDPSRRLVASLFLGTALSISSIKIVATVIRDMDFMRRNLGQIIVAAAILEDTAGWIVISITLGIAGAGRVALGSLAMTVCGTLLFLALSYTVGRQLVFRLIKWVNDTFVSEYAVITAILIVMCLMALATQAIGVNTVLGAFVAGVLVGESPILSGHIEDELRGFITAFMMPIFFGLSGLSADLTVLAKPDVALLAAGLIAIACVGKFSGAFAGGRLGGLSVREAMAAGCAMNARGSTEVIVASIGMAAGVLTSTLYSVIVTMAVVTTSAMPPMLRWALGRVPLRRGEKSRLEKESIDADGFVGGLERLLIAADESTNGKLATRLAGFLAGRRGMPITVLQIGAQDGETSLKDAALDSAKHGHRTARKNEAAAKPEHVAVSARTGVETHEEVVREASKGYDLIFIGVERMRRDDGRFTAQVSRAAAGFDGPLALVFAGRDEAIVDKAAFTVLVPLNGTEPSRRGLEVALAISPAPQSEIVPLYTPERAAARAKARKTAKNELLKDVAMLAKRYGHRNVRTAIRSASQAGAAILEEARQSNCDLIAIGVNRRVGEHLYLGDTVSSVLAGWKGAVLVVVS